MLSNRSARYEALVAEVLALPELDKFQLFDLLRADLLRGLDPETPEHQLVRRRREALMAIEQVAKHLELPPGKAPTGPQFERVAKELGLDWNQKTVTNIWERWSMATAAFTGERRVEAKTVRLQRRYAYHTPGRSDYIRQVRLWLNTGPAAETRDAYDAFAKEHNQTALRRSDRVVMARTIERGLVLTWASIIAVGRGQITLEKADTDELNALLPKDRQHGLLSIAGIAKVMRSSNQLVQQAADTDKHFPVPVASISGHRAWLYSDIRAYKRHLTPPKRAEYEHQHAYMDSPELASRLDLKIKTVKWALTEYSWDTVPPPEGRLATMIPYWRRIKVEHWIQGKSL